MKFIELLVNNNKGGVSTIFLNVDCIVYVTYVEDKIDEIVVYCESGDQYKTCLNMDFIFNFSENFIWASELREDFFNIKKIEYIKKDFYIKSSLEREILYFLALKGISDMIGITHSVFDEIKNKSL